MNKRLPNHKNTLTLGIGDSWWYKRPGQLHLSSILIGYTIAENKTHDTESGRDHPWIVWTPLTVRSKFGQVLVLLSHLVLEFIAWFSRYSYYFPLNVMLHCKK